MPTHAHGHGYSDLNFLIPELVSGVQFRKGPYFAEEGDFAAAGAAHIRYVNALDRPALPRERRRGRLGSRRWRRRLRARATGGCSWPPSSITTTARGPAATTIERLNGVVRYSVGDTLNAWSLTAMGYDGSWQATDQAPRRAIDCRRVLPRFGGVDDTTGGDTSRSACPATGSGRPRRG